MPQGLKRPKRVLERSPDMMEFSQIGVDSVKRGLKEQPLKSLGVEKCHLLRFLQAGTKSPAKGQALKPHDSSEIWLWPYHL